VDKVRLEMEEKAKYVPRQLAVCPAYERERESYVKIIELVRTHLMFAITVEGGPRK
jgi:hypothetical protein